MNRYTVTIYIEFETTEELTEQQAHEIAEEYYTSSKSSLQRENANYWRDEINIAEEPYLSDDQPHQYRNFTYWRDEVIKRSLK